MGITNCFDQTTPDSEKRGFLGCLFAAAAAGAVAVTALKTGMDSATVAFAANVIGAVTGFYSHLGTAAAYDEEPAYGMSFTAGAFAVAAFSNGFNQTSGLVALACVGLAGLYIKVGDNHARYLAPKKVLGGALAGAALSAVAAFVAAP